MRMPRFLIALIALMLLGSVAAGLGAQGPADHPATTSPAPASAPVVYPYPAVLTKAQEDEVMNFFKEMGSEKHAQWLALRENSPAAFQSEIRTWYYWMMGIRRYPERYQRACVQQLDAYARAARLVARLRAAAGEARGKQIIDDLQKEVVILFDAQMVIREHRLGQLKEQLAQLEAEQDRNKANRENLIKDALRMWLLSTQPATAAAPASRAGPLTTARPATAPALPAVTRDQEEQTLEFFKAMGSEKHDQLVALRETNPATYQSMIRSWYYWVAAIKRAPEKYWKAYVIQQESFTRASRLVERLRQAADETQRAALIDDLRKEVSQLVDAQVLIREHGLEQLRDRLAQLQADLVRNQQNRSQIIQESLRTWVLSAKGPSATAASAPARGSSTNSSAGSGN
jgi:hypothetical protein